MARSTWLIGVVSLAFAASAVTLDVTDSVPGWVTVNRATTTVSAPPPVTDSGISMPEGVHGAALATALTDARPDASVQRAAAAALKELLQAEPEAGVLVADAHTGAVVAAARPTTAFVPASNTKIFGTAAVARIRGLGARATTQVLREGDHLTLVAGGDLLLGEGAPNPVDAQGYGSLRDLGQQALRQLRQTGTRRVTFSVQAGQWGQPLMNPGVDPDDQYVFEGLAVPLAIDTGLDGKYSYVRDPINEAATVFSGELEAGGITVERVKPATATTGGEVVARTPSAPEILALRRVLKRSDNTLADALCLQAAQSQRAKTGTDTPLAGYRAIATPGFPSVAPQALQAGAHLADCSGMSSSNRVSPRQIVTALLADAHDPATGALVGQLPVGGLDGTLDERFRDPQVAGRVRAKTGTLYEMRALSGFITGKNGHDFVFAILAPQGEKPAAAGAGDAAGEPDTPQFIGSGGTAAIDAFVTALAQL